MTEIETGLIQLVVYVGGVIVAIVGTKKIESNKGNGSSFVTYKNHALICKAITTEQIMQIRDFIAEKIESLKDHFDDKVEKLEDKVVKSGR
jgi:hypothetical protein